MRSLVTSKNVSWPRLCISVPL